ncbi:toxin biosynthesis protein [Penicillium frequentans]|nr:toxin biosynthesis protein [Penicillium glabrum]
MAIAIIQLFSTRRQRKERQSTPVTLSTSKHQEVLMYTRPNLDRHQEPGLPQTGEDDERPPPHDPLFFPDVLSKLPKGYQFYRYESILAWRMLPHLRPSVLYIGGYFPGW